MTGNVGAENHIRLNDEDARSIMKSKVTLDAEASVAAGPGENPRSFDQRSHEGPDAFLLSFPRLVCRCRSQA